MKKFDDLDIIIPISLELDHPTRESVVAEILEQHENYGFNRFMLACPCGGWRSVGYPPTELFRERAELFLLIKNDLAPYGIECGWWITATLKSGHSSEFSPIIRPDGEPHPFSNCPLDPTFRKIFAENVALFASIAKPAFIITEDDFSIHAASGEFGCFCPHHMRAFAERMGREYTRDELVASFTSRTADGYVLLRKWRELMHDSLVGCAEAVRAAVDAESPEIPIGYMQSIGADRDGDVTADMARALAGKNHTPFSRIYGTFYGDVRADLIPGKLFHPFYFRQHIEGEFRFYHESDTFPHNRFFTAGAEMRAMMSAVYSMGFDGSTFQTQQLLDHANEESAYGSFFRDERKRFNAVHRVARECEVKGVEICYDPFYNTVDSVVCPPHWVRPVSLFSIPYTTRESSVAFIDRKQAEFWDDETIKKYLSKTLFIDGDAAAILCARGYGEYLGVCLSGEEVTCDSNIRYDLGAREVICEEYRKESKGHNMPSPYMFSVSNGRMLKMQVTDPECRVITEMRTFRDDFISVAMTLFKNKLGGNIVVMGITAEDNYSQSLLNYRRQRLVQGLITELCDEFAYAKETARVFTVMNEAKEQGDTVGMLTLINLGGDTLAEIPLHLPEKWRGCEFFLLDREGEWQRLDYSASADGIDAKCPISYLEAAFILCKRKNIRLF